MKYHQLQNHFFCAEAAALFAQKYKKQDSKTSLLKNKKAKVMCHFYLALGLFAAKASTVTAVATQIFLRLSKAPQPKLLWLKSWSSSCTTIYNYFELSWQAQIYSLAQIPQGKEIVHKMDVEIHSSKCNFGKSVVETFQKAIQS